MNPNLEKIKSSKSLKELLEFSIINIDKPSGPTSFSVSQFVKNSLKLRKTSHLGTLDPAVTGVLPVALSRACRLSSYLMHKNKTYVGIMRIHKPVSEEKLEKTIEKFVGKIKQLPPKRSRVKRAIREREVKFFKILEIQDKNVLFETEVQAGTYIRRICDDIGKEIGGAHMLELRRTKAGIFSEQDKKCPSIKLYDFEKALERYKEGNEEPLRKIIVPAEEPILEAMPALQLKTEKSLKNLLTGKPLIKEEIILPQITEEKIFSLFNRDKFVGIYRLVSEGEIIARPEFVFN